MKLSRYALLPLIISIILFFIPFFWFKPGEMDLGGDSSRLYFYDPLRYLTSQALYSVSHSGLGGEGLNYFGIPFFLLLAGLKSILNSPTLLIAFVHGFSLSVAFFTCYLIGKQILTQNEEKQKTHNNLIIEIGALIGGLYYVFGPVAILNWKHMLLPDNQIFLNPLIFFLLLRYVLTHNFRYLIVVLVITFLFSPNFSYVGAPAFFAFYPLSLAFLALYTVYIVRKSLPWKGIAVGFFLFLLLQAFQLGPQAISLLAHGSPTNESVFSQEAKLDRGLGYFNTLVPSIKPSISLLSLPQMTPLKSLSVAFIIFPIVFVLGFFWNRRRSMLLIGIFFLITFFFVVANITDIGLKFYTLLFHIPGFSMFRVYFGQWAWVYFFFYGLLLGQCLTVVLAHSKKSLAIILACFIPTLLIINAWSFITGKSLNITHWQSKDVSAIVAMDPQYEEVLSYLRQLPVDGKILSLPLTDPGYQIVKGENEAAYEGPSTITYLAGRNEFVSFVELESFGTDFLKASHEKNYAGIREILSMLNIKYIFHNSDPFIYGENFPGLPYEHVRNFLPQTQDEYKVFIKQLGAKEIKSIAGKYHIYELDDASYLPHIYSASREYYVNQRKNDTLIPLLFHSPEKHVALYSPNSIHKDIESFDGIFLRAQSQNFYTSAIPKAVDPSQDQTIQPATNKIKELENQGAAWQKILPEYVTMMHKLIDEANGISDESTFIANKVKINQVLDIHEANISKTLLSSKTISNPDKGYLSSLADKTFYQLKEKLNLSIASPTVLKYEIDIPAEGMYEVYMTKNSLSNLAASTSGELVINGKRLLPNLSQSEESLLRLEDIRLEPKKQVSVLLKNLEYTNLIHKTPWHTFDQTLVEPSTVTFVLNDTVGNNQGLFLGIDFKPSTPYFISFDYNSNAKSFWVNLYEIVDNPSGNPSKIATVLISNVLRSQDWKTFRGVVQTGNSPRGELLLQIIPDSRTTYFANVPSKIEIKNITATEIPQPQIILRKLKPIANNETPPEITFTKVNPTRYKIQVKNAKIPYTLVFLQQFNENWKLIDPASSASGISAALKRVFSAMTYLILSVFTNENADDSIKEKISYDQFFNGELFATLGKATIADDKHYLVNGYANAWHIESSDVNGRNEYTLILEMQKQQTFYLFAFISILTMLFCLAWLSVLLYLMFKRILK